MADEVFRPTRKAVNPDAADNQKVLTEMAEFRATADNSSESPNPVGNFQVQGNIPNELASQFRQAKQSGKKLNDSPTNGLLVKDNRVLDMLAAIKQNSALFEEITLPSQGKFYDGTTGPSDGKIHIRPMTGEEEMILATPRFVKKGQAINMIFNRCMQEQYDSVNFLAEDRAYMLIYLRGISYSHEYEVEVKCPMCDRKFATIIDLNGLIVSFCPDEFSGNSLKDIMPVNKLHFAYRLATGADEQRVQDYRDRRLKNFDTAGLPDDTISYRTALLLESIGDIVDKHDIQLILKALPTSDLNYLRNIVNQPPFGVDTKVEISCPGCLQDFEMQLPLESDFFFPRTKKKIPSSTRA